MLYQSFGQIISSLLYSSLFGIMMGIIGVGINAVIDSFEALVLFPKLAFKSSYGIKAMKSVIKSMNCKEEAKSSVKQFTRDFLYVLVYGILFSLLLYVAADGMFRLYVFAVCLFFTFAFDKTLGKWLEFIFIRIIYALRVFLLIALSLALIPMRIISRFVYKRVIMRIYAKIKVKNKLKVKVKTHNAGKETKKKLCKTTKKSQ
ncbi:MAG: hypothetical protein IJY23_03725 [Clostridia bacterium]|nr:hypothetical protein [Clostridia bacterium]